MQIEEEKVDAVTDFIFLGSTITVDGDCSHEFKRRLLLGRTAMTNLDSVLKSRDHFVDKGLYSQYSSAIRVAYLRLLLFLPAILISAFASSSPVILMIHSAYKLNKQGDNIQP